jgi:recombinational DNA repair protein RecR
MSTRSTRAASARTRAATRESLCVVEEVADLWALDRSRLFPGRFHVLGGRLSALGRRAAGGSAPSTSLSRRVAAGGIDEVVLAMNATLEGQTTAHYIAERLEAYPVRVTQLAHGLAGRRRARLSRRGHAGPGVARAPADRLKGGAHNGSPPSYCLD